MAAIKNNGNALQYVKFQTPEMCAIARASSGDIILPFIRI